MDSVPASLEQRNRVAQLTIEHLAQSELELHDAIEDARSHNRILGELLSTALSKARMTSCSCK
jgi:hypothetical protein